MFIELEGVYQHSQIRKEVVLPLDYEWLAKGFDNEEDTILSSFSSNSNKDLEAIVKMKKAKTNMRGHLITLTKKRR